ncbi:hypothetical protein [Botrimarina sp.]|uniref:hypothetical protein n=1 Tax=Botrimarina sp. TaxID=2795802 RepID=UPI0032EE616B
MRALGASLVLRLLVIAGAGPACAQGQAAFGPPAAAAGSEGPLRVAMTRGVSAPGQPVVGRFGLFPPPPAPAPELPHVGHHPENPAPGKDKKAAKADEPPLPEVPYHPPLVDPRAGSVPTSTGDFSADAFFAPYAACDELGVYHDKHEVATQRPLVEWGQPFYGPGPTPVGSELFGPTNLVIPKFYVYGDYRIGATQAELVGSEETTLAHRLNLELDYWITSTERFHAFLGPFQRDARFMRVVDGEFFNELDLFQAETDTFFFEGDLGAMLGGLEGTYAPFDAPVALGLIPLVFQNGVWALDAVVGAAVTIPARHSTRFDWSNYDITFFTGLDRLSTGALGFEEGGGRLFGATTFIEARGGYFEIGYGFVDDNNGGGRSYHNVGASYTRRYANLISNSVRVIANAGQDAPGLQTAEGVLLLVENSFLTKNPYNAIPYVNVFAGFERPQPLVRAGVFGGVLFNTGILFQVDQLTSYPTLDAQANNTAGAAVGIDFLSPEFDQQLILEAAALARIDPDDPSSAAGAQYGLGMRWQKRLTTAHLVRADAMVGFLENSDDIAGVRIEYRWKF